MNWDRAIRAAVAHLGTTLAARPDDARLAGPVRRLRAGRGEPAALWEAHDVTVRRSFSSNNGALSRNTQAAAPRPPYTPRCFHHRRGEGRDVLRTGMGTSQSGCVRGREHETRER
ncbi:hypothetical protein [Streptomyces hygroscopicus]|uniref:MmyB family transcriptional regulator n=1 Tax=Streptomyces hygroscopicus TaxID=1912 RepID=UPI002547F0FB|nr:hypothetical protein [Streptomyces hygroscopicus]